MTDLDTISDAPTPAASVAATSVSSPKLSQSADQKSFGTVLLILLLILVTGAASVYMWREQSSSRLEITDISDKLRRQTDEVGQIKQGFENRLQQLQSQTDTSTNNLASLQLRLEQLHNNVETHQQLLKDLTSNAREDWLLAEVEYLVKMAQQKLQLESDSGNALTLLHNADQRVQQASSLRGELDTELFELRKQLSEQILTLEQFTPVDRQGIYLRLNAMAQSVEQLPRAPNSSFTASDSPPSQTTRNPLDGEESWQSRIWREITQVFGKLEDYIRIDSVKTPAKPLLDANLIQLANMNLRLLLEQAQWGVMRANNVLYQQSLTQAQTLLQKYYVESPQTDQLIQQFGELQTLDVAPKLPDISNLVSTVQQRIKLPQNLSNQTPKASE
jgi:uroporphyrin-III C-methyltransferase